MRKPSDPWDLESPQDVMDHVAAHAPLKAGDVVVATIRVHDDGARGVVDVTTIHSGPRPNQDHAEDLVRSHADRVVGVRPFSTQPEGRVRQGPDHVFATVVCRHGMVVPSPEEYAWIAAWFYSNHGANAFSGDVYVMTEHGWTGTFDRRSGFSPRLDPEPMASARPSVPSERTSQPHQVVQ